MMPSQNHIMKKQIFEIELPPGLDNERNLQSEISTLFHNTLLPLMEETFDRVSTDSRVVIIERMEVDLGNVNLSLLAEQLPQKFQKNFSRILEEYLFSIQMQQELKNSGISIPIKKDVRAVAVPEEEAIARILIFFLRNGQMPWNTPAELRQMGFSNILLKLLGEHSDVAVKILQSELTHSIQLHRFILQNSNRNLIEILKGCIEHHSPDAPESRRSLITLIRFAGILLDGGQLKKIRGFIPYRDLRFRLWKNLTEQILLKPQSLTPSHSWLRKEIVQMILIVSDGKWTIDAETGASVEKAAGPLLDQLIPQLEQSRQAKSAKTETLVRDLILTIQEHHKKVLKSHQPGNVRQTNKGKEASAEKSGDLEFLKKNRQADQPDEQKNMSARPDKDFKKQNEKPEFKKPSVDENMHPDTEILRKTDKGSAQDFIEGAPGDTLRVFSEYGETEDGLVLNAGMVILHPFLNTFFGRIGLIEEKMFITETARERAVHLLQYLVTGNQEAPEEELLLNKLFCGIEPEYPVNYGIELTPQEKEESRNLLVNVIEQWSALKRTSPEALRGTFLQRKGLISRDRTFGGWKLNVERTSVDVLLNRLPWGISIIKMPWNPYIITVEW